MCARTPWKSRGASVTFRKRRPSTRKWRSSSTSISWAESKAYPRPAYARRIDEVMQKTAITDVRNKEIGKLSKGYRQRVGLAQAIMHNPDVLILDEPTSGLDPHQIIETRDLIKGLVRGPHHYPFHPHPAGSRAHLPTRHDHHQRQAGGHRHDGESDQPSAWRGNRGGGGDSTRRHGFSRSGAERSGEAGEVAGVSRVIVKDAAKDGRARFTVESQTAATSARSWRAA